MKKILSIALIIFLFFATPVSSAILFYEDFEDVLDFDARWLLGEQHGSQELTTEQIRYGARSYKFSLTRYNSGDYKQGMVCIFEEGNYHFTIGEEYWIGFSLFLADGYYCNNWVLHHQYHGSPDKPPTCDPTEPWRNPVLRVGAATQGNFYTYGIWDSRQCTPAIGDYEGSYSDYDGVPPVGQWLDFVINVKWSYGEDGFLKIWKNGASTTDRTGGNCFNDIDGPYLWIGIYGTLDQDQTMTVYYDELRVGDSYSSYSEVAPGDSTLPTVTTQAVADITTTTATGHGTITNTGGENATKRGICWNTTGNPTVADDKIEEEGNFSTGAFSGNMTGLTPDQAYFARAYAYNIGGYGYGGTEGFNTDADANGTYVVDNGDNGTSSTGTWHTSGGVNPYGVDSVYADTDATYSFEKTLDGNYTISVWWTVAGTNRDTNATIEIYDGVAGDNLLATHNVNQQASGGQWNELATYDFDTVTKVVVVSTADDPVVATSADAVKFDYVEGSGGEDVNTLSRMPGICLQGCGIN